ncbi:DUF4865 family protein [Luteimonas fraxinea]|uniref:DUF4865 family protein n=1 Tax=Luteimonas fraxinea TaxID=2901869 RepID=A0ABS8UCG6_9GAMM|nr:DUF4865 family protein [Luteimonas fraxinea]MCD9097206.1 DUF4865 family protein [Luteimonas fraxinea]MCD9125228.1 DUF4865 family protein [Luteimonas fraxinea]
MLVTHYAIPLADAQLAEIRERIRVIGPDFDVLPGLAAKLFLLASDTPCYALYYLWRTPDALHDFLDGPRFAALCERFGRPELTHYLTRAPVLPFVPGQRLDIAPSTGTPIAGDVLLDDLRLGGRTTLRSAAHGRFEVVYVAGSHNLPATLS